MSSPEYEGATWSDFPDSETSVAPLAEDELPESVDESNADFDIYEPPKETY